MEAENNTNLSNATISLLADCMNLVAQPVSYTDQLIEKMYKVAKALSELHGDEFYADYNNHGAFSIFTKSYDSYHSRTRQYDVMSVSNGVLTINNNYSILVSAARDYVKAQSGDWFHDSNYDGSYGYYSNGVTYKRSENTFNEVSFPVRMVMENNILEEIIGRYIDLKDKSYKQDGTSQPDGYMHCMDVIEAERTRRPLLTSPSKPMKARL